MGDGEIIKLIIWWHLGFKARRAFQKPQFCHHNQVLVVARKLAISVAFGDKATSAELIKMQLLCAGEQWLSIYFLQN